MDTPTNDELKKELLSLKLKLSHSAADKFRIQKLQQLIDKI